jgi:hypothetical protein
MQTSATQTRKTDPLEGGGFVERLTCPEDGLAVSGVAPDSPAACAFRS